MAETSTELFSYKNHDNFWEEFSKLTLQNNKKYKNDNSANSANYSNIEFPKSTGKDFFKEIGTTPNSVTFNNCIFGDTLDLDWTQNISNITFNDCIFTGNVSINGKNTKMISMDTCTFNANFILKEYKVRDSSTRFHVNNITFNSLFELKNCSLNTADPRYTTKFTNIDFQKAHVKIINTSLIGTVFNNIKWAKEFESTRDTFRQLKFLMIEQHSYIDSNLFHSLELNEYKKDLFKTKWNENFEDKVVFVINDYTSSFSRSWLLPLFWLITISIIMYTSLYHFQGREVCSFNDFMHFFNPLSRRVDEKFEDYYGTWFSHKIIAGFLVYQMIVALKRKTKV